MQNQPKDQSHLPGTNPLSQVVHRQLPKHNHQITQAQMPQPQMVHPQLLKYNHQVTQAQTLPLSKTQTTSEVILRMQLMLFNNKDKKTKPTSTS